jgi:hypothetical protein
MGDICQFLFEIDSAEEYGVRTSVYDQDALSSPDLIGTSTYFFFFFFSAFFLLT